MPAELETGQREFQTIIDAPPGIIPPLPESETAQTPALIASPPEAIFSSQKNETILFDNCHQVLMAIPYDIKAPYSPPPKLTNELQQIFSNPIKRVPVPVVRGKNESPPVPRSVEVATEEHLLEGQLERTRVTTNGGDIFVYTGTTERGKAWIIGTPSEGFQVTPQETPHRLNGAGEELKTRQGKFLPKGGPDLRHDSFVNFFAINWGKLAPIFSEADIPVGDSPLQRFIEVELNDLAVEVKRKRKKRVQHMGIVDFVGELPDGQLAVIEFRTPGQSKTKQIARHTRGIREVAGKHNGKSKIPQVSQFIATYTEVNGQSLVKIIPKTEQLTPFM